MPLTITENYLSRSFSIGRQCNREIIYDITGGDPTDSTEEDAVRALVVATAPPVYWGRIIETINPQVVGPGLWKATVKYVTWETEFTFDTTGGSQHMTQSLATIASYAPPGMTAPDFGGAIGVSDDSVAGVDVPNTAGAFLWSETYRIEDANITNAYKLSLFALSPSMNIATFRFCNAGEALFLGCTGTKRGDDLWALTFRFAGSPNLSGVTYGTITGISKLGWDYLWFRYADFADTSAYALVKRPIAAYVERVVQPCDFSLLEI